MSTGWKKIAAVIAVTGLILGAEPATLQAGETGLQPDGRFIVGADASKVIGEYLAKVSGRFGALAISEDGVTAAYYICQSRVWKNCDDYGLEDSSISVPSGQLAAKLAADRCRGVTEGECLVLFINDKWKREFTLAQ
ncbi:MAG: hypothetical protein R3D05_14235 [Dongiaceae bacterium]